MLVQLKSLQCNFSGLHHLQGLEQLCLSINNLTTATASSHKYFYFTDMHLLILTLDIGVIKLLEQLLKVCS